MIQQSFPSDENRSQLFFLLAENSHEFIGMCDADFMPFYVNPAGLELVGLSDIDEARHIPVREYFYPEDQPFIIENFFPRVVEQGQNEVEIRFRHFRTGAAIWMIYGVFALKDAEGALVGYATSSRDITERKATEEALRHSEELNRRTLQALPAEIAVLDRDGQIIATNQAWQDFASGNAAANEPSVAVGGNYLEICRRAAQDGAATSVFGALKDIIEGRRQEFSLEYPCHSPEKQRWFLMTAVPLGARGGAVITHLNITERKQAETALRDADQAKDNFLAMLAHELRNPLASIRNGLDVLRKLGAQDSSVDHLLGTMDGQADHLTRLVDDLMDVSRISLGKFKLQKRRIDLAATLAQAIDMSRHLFKAKNLDLRMDASCELMPLDGDSVRLTQVFANLLTNAAKYTHPGGRVQVRLERIGDEASVSIGDTGAGISRELLPKIFDPFVQGDGEEGRLKQGLGIGLALARTITEMHGGVIEARSEGEELGSTFMVRLPLIAGMAGEEPPLNTSSAPTRVGATRRILVIDDVPEVAESLALLLKVMGAEVRVAHSGAEGLELCADFEPDLVLLDLSMPKMDGFATARRMREFPAGKRTKLVAVTGLGEEQARTRVHEAGFDGQLVKPASARQLEELLTSVSAETA